MPLSPGARLGHYDITSLLGEGGMDQVWQATDTQLNREVALKILPDAFASDPDRLARFTREAQIFRRSSDSFSVRRQTQRRRHELQPVRDQATRFSCRRGA